MQQFSHGDIMSLVVKKFGQTGFINCNTVEGLISLQDFSIPNAGLGRYILQNLLKCTNSNTIGRPILHSNGSALFVSARVVLPWQADMTNLSKEVVSLDGPPDGLSQSG